MSNVAVAKEMASASGSRVNKDADSLLRYGLPINSKEVSDWEEADPSCCRAMATTTHSSAHPFVRNVQVRKLQATLENIKVDIGTKRKAAALDGVKKAKNLIASDSEKYKASCRDPNVCSDLIASMSTDLGPMTDALKESLDVFQGSEQERTALDSAYTAQEKIVGKLSDLEEQMVPKGYKTFVPDAYVDLPQLQGRATVEMLIQKPDKGLFDVSGVTFPEARLTMVIDGYAAPVTGGNFVDLVQKGFYDKMDIQRSDGFVVQTGEPKGDAIGYVGPGSKSVGNGKNGERLIPLEIFVKGDKGPFYETTIEDEGRGGQATVLPFSSYGAMGWARDEYEANSGSSQFFWLLFDSDLTPAGKNVLDGRYPVFGYVVKGSDFLQDVKEGDIIVSAKVISGAENLQQPK
jgi:cyclophilin family peptidyl-prolyl cis-trans isomerase